MGKITSRLSTCLDTWRGSIGVYIAPTKDTLLGQMVTSMWCGQILAGSDRDNTGGIDVVVRHVVVPLNMVEIHRVGDALGLVEILEIPEEIGVIDDSPDITFKMSMVDGVEPNQRDKESPVGFHKLQPEEVPPTCQARF